MAAKGLLRPGLQFVDAGADVGYGRVQYVPHCVEDGEIRILDIQGRDYASPAHQFQGERSVPSADFQNSQSREVSGNAKFEDVLKNNSGRIP
jgi:hypothetical protein